MGMAVEDPVSKLSLPPGFRFYPTDEELLVQYLCRKVAGHHFTLQIIGEIDLYKFDPWILPSKAVFGEKEWYFFSPRDRKYPNGSRPNRVAGSGYWKATGTDKIITTEGRKMGNKKALVFYVGKAPKGTKTNWIMHEYRLLESSRKNGSSRLDEWVLCRLYKKNSSASHQKLMIVPNIAQSKEHSNKCSYSSSSSQFDDVLESLPEIEDRSFALPRVNSLRALQDQKLNFNNSTGKFDYWSNLPAAVPEVGVNGSQNQNQPLYNDVYNPLSIPPLTHPDSPSEKFGSSIEEEVESGLGGLQRLDDSGLFKNSSAGSAGSPWLAQSYSDSVDPFGLRFLTTQQQEVPQGRFWYGQ